MQKIETCCLCGKTIELEEEKKDAFPLVEQSFQHCCKDCYNERVLPAKASKAFSVAEKYVWGHIGHNIIEKEAAKRNMEPNEFGRAVFVTWFKDLYYLDFLGFDKYLKGNSIEDI